MTKDISLDWFSRIKDFDFWVICDGESELIDEQGRRSILTRGSALWIRPGQRFELKVDRQGRYRNCFIHFDFMDHNGQIIPPHRVQTPPTLGFVHDCSFFESVMRRINFLQYHRKESSPKVQAATRQIVSHLLKGLLHEYDMAQAADVEPVESGVYKHHARMVSSALAWLYENPGLEITASGLAKKYGYSSRHFCRIFREVTGKTPAQSLIDARVDQAKKLLSASSLNVTEIADNLGYRNVFYFSHQFKRQTGLSPMEFRQRGLR